MDNMNIDNSNTNMSETIFYNTNLQKKYKKSNISLFGPPGSGKTYLSKLLGKELGMEVYDIDDDHLESEWGITVSEKLNLLGDEGFIQAEAGKKLYQILIFRCNNEDQKEKHYFISFRFKCSTSRNDELYQTG